MITSTPATGFLSQPQPEPNPKPRTRVMRTQRQWKALLNEFNDSGLTRSAFCKKHRIATSSLYRWQQLFTEQSGEATDDRGRLGVRRPDGLLDDGQRALGKPFGLGVVALGAVELGQVAQAQGHVSVIRPKRFLPDRQRLPLQRLGLVVQALAAVERRQVVEQGGGGRVVGAELLVAQPERFLGEGKRLLVAALGVQFPGPLVGFPELLGLAAGHGGPQP